MGTGCLVKERKKGQKESAVTSALGRVCKGMKYSKELKLLLLNGFQASLGVLLMG